MNRRRILVAFDGSDASFRALEQAAQAAERSDAQIGVVTVMPAVVNAPGDALRYLTDRGLEAALYVPVGDPVTEIARVANEGAYNAVYVGSRSDEGEGDLPQKGSRGLTSNLRADIVIAA
jgi:nucleotide-binding universal stress UspA family protein